MIRQYLWTCLLTLGLCTVATGEEIQVSWADGKSSGTATLKASMLTLENHRGAMGPMTSVNVNINGLHVKVMSLRSRAHLIYREILSQFKNHSQVQLHFIHQPLFFVKDDNSAIYTEAGVEVEFGGRRQSLSELADLLIQREQTFWWGRVRLQCSRLLEEF